jgi:hypothetical protein
MTIEDLINKYPKIFQDYVGNPERCNWDIPKSWIPIVDMLCASIQNYVDTVSHYDKKQDKWVGVEQVTCFQMKEKYGSLCFYTNGNDEFVNGMIYLAEHLSHNTCQDCGSNEDLGTTSDWIAVLCRKCVIANGDRAMNGWKPLNKNK